MESESIWNYLFLTILLGLSAFFSASETAFTSMSKLKIRHLIDANVKGAKQIGKLMSNPTKMLSAILVGNNVVNITATSIATSIAIHHLGNNGTGIAALLTTILILLFGEIAPKTAAKVYSEKAALTLAFALQMVVTLLTPIAFIFTQLSDLFLFCIGKNNKPKEVSITEEELKTMVHVSQEEGVLESDEHEMILNVIEFTDTEIGSIMTPRTEIIGVNVNASYEDVYQTFKEYQYSRMPVYQNSLDEIVGILHLKDLMLFDKTKVYKNKDFMKEPYLTFENMRVSDVFKRMKATKCTMGVVLDEYGGTAGIVTIEDFVEEIVGDIDDEYDDESEKITVINEQEILAEGSADISEVNEKLDIKLSDERFNTIGGFITGELGKFPVKGDDFIYHENIEFIIESANRNKIEKVRIKKLDQETHG